MSAVLRPGCVQMTALLLLLCLLGPYAVVGSPSSKACQPCDLAVRQGPSGKLQVVHNPSPSSQLQTPSPNIVWARYWNTYEDTGWDRIEISSLAAVPVPNSIKARAAGYAEGQIHADKIYNYWNNYRLNEFYTSDHQPTKALLDWIDDQDRFVRKRIKDNAAATAQPKEEDKESEYWRLMGLVMDHFDGLCEGVWDAADPDRNLTYHELYLLQSVGDLYDLKVVFPQRDIPEGVDSHGDTPEVVRRASDDQGRASDDQGASGTQGPTSRTKASGVRSGGGREYRPGHGIVGPDSFGGGDMLECSALIKLQTQDSLSVSTANAVRVEQSQQDLHGLRQTPGWDDTQARPQARPPQLGGRKAGSARTGQQQLVQDVLLGAQAAAAPSRSGRPPKNFWAGHATWRSYYAMVRTWKVYQFPWSNTGPITVSSSPGFVAYSKDDWYSTDNFVVMETTNGIYNDSLYDAIDSDCALMWQRVQVANLGARTGAEWVSLFRKYNSGTYNNQWMVLDVHRLMKGHQDNVLWVLEQLPGTTEAADVTAVLLKQGYWASYNVPYFPRIYNLSGYPSDKDMYHISPRAQLFEREQAEVASTQDMQALMRLNRYSTDPLSQGNPAWAIASRYDLQPKAGVAANWTRRAFGAVDAKIVDWWSFRNQVTYVVNGPTSDDLPCFSWNQFCKDIEGTVAIGGPSSRPSADGAVKSGEEDSDGPSPGVCDSHEGLVDVFDFGWQGLQASLPWLLRRRG